MEWQLLLFSGYKYNIKLNLLPQKQFKGEKDDSRNPKCVI